jgi:hypothetical protein
MMLETLRQIWLEIEDVAGPLADIRDTGLSAGLSEKRFALLTQTYTSLRTAEQALYEYIHERRDLSGRREDIDRLILTIADSALRNGSAVLQLAREDLERVQTSRA